MEIFKNIHLDIQVYLFRYHLAIIHKQAYGQVQALQILDILFLQNQAHMTFA